MQETYQAVIVEDDPMIASIDQNFLERDPRFHLAASFRSGQDALPWLLRHPADLLILDVYMPRMTGLELLRELRSFGVTSGVVMVTAANDSKTVDALLKLGVADYLVKPLPPAAFSRRWISSAASAPPSTPTAASARRSWTPCSPAPPVQRTSRRGSSPALWSGSGPIWPRPRRRAAPVSPWLPRPGSPPSPSAGTSPTSPSRARWSAGSTMTPAAAPPSSIICPRTAREDGPAPGLSDRSPAGPAGSFFRSYPRCGNFLRPDLKFCWASTCIFSPGPV